MADQLTLGDLIWKLGFSNDKEFVAALENQFKLGEKLAAESGKRAGTAAGKGIADNATDGAKRGGEESAKGFGDAFSKNLKSGKGFFASVSDALASVRDESAQKGSEAGSSFVADFAKGIGTVALGTLLADTISAGFEGAISATQEFVDQSVEEYKRYDAGLNQLRISADTNLPAAQERIRAISEEAKIFSETDIAGTVGSLIQSGLNGAQALKSVETGALLAAGALDPVTGQFADLNAVSVGLTTVTRSLGLSFDNTGATADILALAAQKSGTNLEGMVKVVSELGGLSTTTGVGLTDLSASVGYLTNIGFDASAAGTGLNTVINGLLSPTGKLKDQADKLGISFITSTGETRPFMEIIKNLGRVANEGAVGAKFLKDVGLDTYALKVAVALGKGSGEVQKFKNDLENAGGSAQRLADVSRNGLPASLKASEVAAANARKELGQALAPAVAAVTVAMTGAIKEGGNFIRHFGDYAPTLAAITTAIAVLAAGIYGPAALSFALAVIPGLAGAAGTAIAVAFGPVGVAALAISALAATITKLFADIRSAESETAALDAERQRLINNDSTGRLKLINQRIDLYQKLNALQEETTALEKRAVDDRKRAEDIGGPLAGKTPSEKALDAKREEIKLTKESIATTEKEIEALKARTKQQQANKPAPAPAQPRPDLTAPAKPPRAAAGYVAPTDAEIASARQYVAALLDARDSGKGIAEARAEVDKFSKSSKGAAEAVKQVTDELVTQRRQAKAGQAEDDAAAKRRKAEQDAEAKRIKSERDQRLKEFQDARDQIASIEGEAQFKALIEKSTEAQLLAIIAEEKRLAARAKGKGDLDGYNLALQREGQTRAQLNTVREKELALLAQLAEEYRNGGEFLAKNQRFNAGTGLETVAQSQRVRLLAEGNQASDEQIRRSIDSIKSLLKSADDGVIALSKNSRTILESNLTFLEARIGDAADRIFAAADKANLAAEPSQNDGADPLGPTADAIDESLKRIQDGLKAGLSPVEIQADAEYIGRLLEKNLVPYALLGNAQQLFAAYLKLVDDGKTALDEFFAKGNTGEFAFKVDIAPETFARLTEIETKLKAGGLSAEELNALLEELGVIGQNPSLTAWATELADNARAAIGVINDLRGTTEDYLKTARTGELAFKLDVSPETVTRLTQIEDALNAGGLSADDLKKLLEEIAYFGNNPGLTEWTTELTAKANDLKDGLADLTRGSDQAGRSLAAIPDAVDFTGLQSELGKLAETDLTNPEAVGAGLRRIQDILEQGVPDAFKPLAALLQNILKGAFDTIEADLKTKIKNLEDIAAAREGNNTAPRAPGGTEGNQLAQDPTEVDAELEALTTQIERVKELKTELELVRQERDAGVKTETDVLASSFALSDALQKEIDTGLLDIDTIRRLRLELALLAQDRAKVIAAIDPGNNTAPRAPGASDYNSGDYSYSGDGPSDPAPFDSKGLEAQINQVGTSFVTTIVDGVKNGDLQGAFKGAMGNVADFFIGELIKGVVGKFAAELAASIAASVAEAAAAKVATKVAEPVIEAGGKIVEGVIAGGATGSAGGPVGIAIGAGIGLLAGLLPLLFQKKPEPVQTQANLPGPGGTPSINYTAEANVSFQSGASFSDPAFRATWRKETEDLALGLLERLKLINPTGDKTK